MFLFVLSIELLEPKNPPSHFPYLINEPGNLASISKMFLGSINFFPGHHDHIFPLDYYVYTNWPDSLPFLPKTFASYLKFILPQSNLYKT